MNRIALFAAFFFLPFCVLSQVNFNNGLLAYYPFNGNFNDSSGNGNNGIAMNGATFGADQNGNASSAAFFDGINDWVNIPTPSFSFGHTFSIAFRFKTSANYHQVMIAKSNYNTGQEFNFQVAFNHPVFGGGLYVGTNHNSTCATATTGSFSDYGSTANSIISNQWNCVIMTFNNGVKTIYINGVLAAQHTVTAGINPTTADSCATGTFRMGTWWQSDLRYFSGLLDEVRLYNRVLNTQEVDSFCTFLPSREVIINKYAAIQTRNNCDNSFLVDDATGFSAGDTVLMIQMKGAVIDSTNTAAFGAVMDYKDAGNYEYNVIRSKSGNNLTLKFKVQRIYDIVNGKVQFVRVPKYQNYTINIPHTALAWNGAKGGVFAMNVVSTLTLNSNIDVSGKGFRGGSASLGTLFACNSTDYYYNATGNNGGLKGEGIAMISSSKAYGRGALANGGGGGNGHNAGGGGGSNGVGNGGIGGNQYALGPCAVNTVIGGIGGISLNYSNAINKVFLGGGGGCGHGNDFAEGPGGAGGGLIIVNAGAINGNAFGLIANGANAPECSGPVAGCTNDGRGGGGGGGAILFQSNAYTSAVLFKAKGGKGSNTYVATNTTEVAPGGGGSGGVIWRGGANAPTTVIDSVNGGLNGTLPQFANSAFGALPGGAGQIITALQFLTPTDTFRSTAITPSFTDSTVTCFSRKLINTSPAGIVSWSWNAGVAGTSTLSSPTFTFPGYGIFPVTITATDSNGCNASFTRNVVITYRRFASAGRDTFTCAGVTTILRAAGGVSYSWSPAATLGSPNAAMTTATPFITTSYIVTVTDTLGCTDQDTAVITLTPGAQVLAAPSDTLACLGKILQLRASGVVSYEWSPATSLNNAGISDPLATFNGNINYVVTGKDIKGCLSFDTVVITERPAPEVNAYADGDNAISCFSRAIQLHATGAHNYRWEPAGSLDHALIASPIANPTQTTLYTVTGTDEFGCIAHDTITIFSYRDAVVFIPNAFTPNGDGRNDNIRPIIYCDFVFERFEVFNRWGQSVFLSYRNDKAWDGKLKGEPADLGVYMWYVKGHRETGEPVLYKGNITLIR